MTEKNLALLLKKKLTKDDLHKLCTAFDDGSLDDIFWEVLIPQDVKNFPEDYADTEYANGKAM